MPEEQPTRQSSLTGGGRPRPEEIVSDTLDAWPPRRKPASHGFFALRQPISLVQTIVLGFACVAVCAGVWWFVTRGEAEERIFSPTVVPSPYETFASFESLWFDKALTRNTLVTLRRVVLGFSLAAIVGVPLGVLCGCFTRVGAFFSPLTLVGRNIPIAALIPLTFSLFGIGEEQKIMFIFIACVAFIISDTVDAIQDVAERYVETALTLGASRFQVVMKVLVPLAMPSVFNSMRVMFGLAFGYIMLVEIVQESGGAGGLGFLLNIARRRSTPQIMVIIILSIPVVAWLIDQLLYVIQCAIFRWKYAQQARNSLVWRAASGAVRLF